MIFRTITTDLDGAINKIGIFNKSFANLKNVISLKTSNGKINNGVRGLFNSISFGITEKDISNIKEYNRLVGEDGVSSQTAWYQTMMSSSKAAQSLFDNEKNLIMTENGAIVSTEALTVAQNTMSLSTKAAAVGMKTLATAGNMLLMWGISEAVSWAAKGIDNLIHYEEKQKEIFENATKATEEHAKAIHDLKSEMSDTSTKASDLASEYAKLVQGVNSFTNENESLSTDRYEKFLDVNNQLAELFPSLTRNYDENGNAILGLSGDVDTVTASIQRLVEQQTNLAKADMREHLEDYVNGTNDKEGIFDSLKGYKKNVNETQNELNNLQDVYNSIINHKGKRTYIGNDYNTFLDDVKNKLGQEAYDALHSVTDKKYQDKGDTWYSIDFSRLELYEVTKGKIIKSYNTFFNDLQTTLSIRQSELESKNKEMSNQMMIWVEDLDFYKNSNNESFKKAIKSMVGSIQWSDLEVENGDIDEAKQIIQSLIITPLTNACDNPDTKLSVTNALCSVFTINFSDLPYEEAKQQVENFLNIILNALNIGLPDDKKKSIEDLYNAFNLENYRDTPDKMKSSLDSITGDNQEDFKKLTDYTKNFNQSQAEAWLTVTEGAKNADEAIRRFEENQKPAVSSSKLPFDKAWNQLKNNTGAFKDNDDTKDTANNLLELAEAGKLTVKAFEKTKGSDDFLTQTKLSAEEATKQITELVDSSKHLSELKKGIGAIGSAYNEKKDSKENTVNPDTLS